MTTLGDRARVMVVVEVEPREAFRVFTEEIDLWWRHGLKYRMGRDRSVLHFEPKLGGRIFETFHSKAGERTKETGQVTVWQPPARLVFEWRAGNFTGAEKTEVEVLFEPSPSGTRVTLEHRGWSRIRPDHPVRHGEETSVFIGRMGLWWGELLSSLRERVARLTSREPPA